MENEKILSEMTQEEVLAYINTLREQRAQAHLQREINKVKNMATPAVTQKSISNLLDNIMDEEDD